MTRQKKKTSLPVGDQYYGDSAGTYERERKRYRRWAKEEGAFKRFFQAMTVGGTIRSVLDIPCGTGRWISFVDNLKVEYTGLDISGDMIQKAATKAEGANLARCSFVEADYAEFLPLHERAFDLVISTRFIKFGGDEGKGHEIIKLLCNASRRYVLADVKIVAPLYKRPLRTLRQALRGSRMERHSIFHREPLGEWLKDCGFEVVDTVKVGEAIGEFSNEFWLLERSIVGS